MTQVKSILVYLYGFAPLNEVENKTLPKISGIDQKFPIYFKKYKKVVAFVSSVEKEDYSEEELNKNTQNLKWLQEKAFHHHHVLEELQKQFTVIPLKFCTIFKDENNLEEILQNHYSKIISLFEYLVGKKEWNLKIYCDEESLKSYVADHHPSIIKEKEELKQMSSGMQYIKSKLLEKKLQDKIADEKKKIALNIHQEIQTLTLKHHIKDNLSKDVTGRDVTMVFNGVYLISDEKVQSFKELIDELQKGYQNYKLIIEYSGPWPVYHFSSLD